MRQRRETVREGEPLVAVVGRANVGKSTLVNRFLGRRAAIEHPEPGVTRDRQGYPVTWGGVSFTVVDTGGWEPRAKGIAAKVRAQAERAAREADVIVMVADAETGITEDDIAVARGLRGTKRPVILVANKVDSAAREQEARQLERLGLGSVFPVSALHGRRSGDLLDLIVEHVRAVKRGPAEEKEAEFSVAIVGRPNVGKSSLFNRLVDAERAIVHDEPGTTRDAIDTVAEIDGARYRFVDTAGMRHRAKGSTGPEYYGLVRSLRAIDEADLALIVVDAKEGPTDQDQRIAKRVSDAGRAAVVVLNKWDLIGGDDADTVADDVADALRFLPWAPMVRTSALTKRGVSKIVPAVELARASYERRVPTAALNTWLREVAERVPLGSTSRARPIRIRYVTQTRSRPPEFVFFANGTITESGKRGLERRLREKFGFEGTPVRMIMRKGGRP